jgi:hypothetical protein
MNYARNARTYCGRAAQSSNERNAKFATNEGNSNASRNHQAAAYIPFCLR